jgi:cytochrome b6-f complex subunit 4
LYWLSCFRSSCYGRTNKPFATPLEILPEWYFTQFSILRYSSNKLLGVLAMAVPAGLITIPFIESINKFQTLTSSIATILFLLGTLAAVWWCLLAN